jgi:peptidoglycan hydrolase CwlO-like protein
MAGSHPRAHCRNLISALLLSTLVASTLLTVGRAPGSAGADQIASLKAQATAISQKLIQEQLQAGAYQQQYSVVSARATAEAQAIAQVGQQITGDQQQISARTALVRTEAIRAYTDYGTGSSQADGGLFSGNQETAQAASEYSSIAVGNITTAVDLLRSSQRTLQAHQSTLRQQQHQDQLDQSREATYLGQANATEARLTSLNSQVTGQLAAAVAEQAAVQSAAAAAAVTAAQRAAARAPVNRGGSAPASSSTATTAGSPSPAPGPTTTVPSPTPGGTPTGTTDPALNPFLQCVVQAESGGNYGAVSPDGLYMGAFQFSQSTWNTAALAAGRPDLVGVPPNHASKADQDTVAVALYALDGERPWLGDRCSA